MSVTERLETFRREWRDAPGLGVLLLAVWTFIGVAVSVVLVALESLLWDAHGIIGVGIEVGILWVLVIVYRWLDEEP